MKITTEFVMSLDPCPRYPRERVEGLVEACGTKESTAATLLTLPMKDARLILSRALPLESKVLWAQACADRAAGYAVSDPAQAARATATAAARSADDADYYARNADNAPDGAYAAAYAEAADYAAYFAAAHAAVATADASTQEHRIAIEHGIELLFSQAS